MTIINIAFVILHYRTDNDTIECVESIRKKIDTKNYRIVIVDNYSNNGSLKKLNDVFDGSEDVVMIANHENLGFSKGLNVGILYAKKKWNPDFIITANNDICLMSNNIYEVLKQKYLEYGFAVAGPIILTSDGKYYVNPITKKLRDKNEVLYLINKHKLIRFLNRVHALWIYKLANIAKAMQKQPRKERINISLFDQIDYKLHGSFWIFSRIYFEKFDALDPATFLYGEESLLFLHIQKNYMHTLFTPDIVIYHKEDSSTNSLKQKTREKTEFICKHSIECLQYYLQVLEHYEEIEKGDLQ